MVRYYLLVQKSKLKILFSKKLIDAPCFILLKGGWEELLLTFQLSKKVSKDLSCLRKKDQTYENMTKKETQMLNREKLKLADQHRGIKDMRRLPDLIVIVDAQYEDTAIKEAKRLDIPTIAIVDSNTDPNKVTFPIPANDDSMRTINIIISALADAVLEAKGLDSNNNHGKDGSLLV